MRWVSQAATRFGYEYYVRWYDEYSTVWYCTIFLYGMVRQALLPRLSILINPRGSPGGSPKEERKTATDRAEARGPPACPLPTPHLRKCLPDERELRRAAALPYRYSYRTVNCTALLAPGKGQATRAGGGLGRPQPSQASSGGGLPSFSAAAGRRGT